jgi:short-subunit dehydrogenase
VARRGLHLVLLARNAERLLAFAASVRSEHNVDVRAIPMDLGRADLASALSAAVEALDVGLLVYNAAASQIGAFLELPLDEQLQIVDVNCRAPVVCGHIVGQKLAARGSGGMIFMSSLAGSQGSPFIATYGASKAFNLMLGEALWYELRDRGVDVLACRAGAVDTPNFQRANPRRKMQTMKPEQVAESALDALGASPSVMPGAFNRVAGFMMTRLMPRRSAVATIGNATRKLYGL